MRDRDASKLFAQLISGVDYLHKKGIIHRDLKLENLLLDKHRNIIITDFGFANRCSTEQADLMTTSCGSPCYAAPELVVSEGEYIGSAVDVWSCGVILYAMLAGYLPFDDDPSNPDGDNINLLYRYITTTQVKFPDHISESARDLVSMILVPDPQYRATMLDVMNHPWLAPHRQLFERTVEMNEWIFQDQMYKKSQQAKRELNERKRVQREAAMAKYRVQRSHSTMPTAGGMEQGSTTRRPKSAMPGSSTVPTGLTSGQRTPPLEAITAARVASRATTPVAPELTPNPSESLSTQAVENQVVGSNAPSTSSLPMEKRKGAESSSNSNRHTIQVEYDEDDLLENQQGSARDKETDAGKHKQLQVQAATMSDIEMSGSEMGHGTAESIDTRLSPISSPSQLSPQAPSAKSTPLPVEPSTPKRKSPVQQAGSPSTPRASNAGQMEDLSATPRASMVTPKGKGREQPTAPARSSMMPPPTIPAPKAQRNRKGMSLDKFGLAKLLGTTQAGSSVDLAKPSPAPSVSSPATTATGSATRALQTSTAVNANAGARPQSLGPSVPAPKVQTRMSSRPPSAAGTDDKKGKRKTLQIMARYVLSLEVEKHTLIDRSSSVREKPNAVPLSARDMNPATAPVQGASEPAFKAPESASRPSMSSARPSNLNSPSVLTVDAVNGGNKTASSSAAKKVMDWFRRRSIARDSNSLQHVKASGRHDSNDSFVRVEPTIAATAMSETSSVAGTADGRETPVVEEDGEGEAREAAATSTVSLAPPIEAPAGPPLDRQALSPSPLPEPTTQPLASIDAAPQPPRVSPPRATPTRSKSHGMPGGTVPSLSSQAGAGAEDSRLRVHTGVLDQSALSSKPPQEVMNEVIRVLMEMGMEVKRENEYRVRCTRVKKKGRGFGSVISMAGGVMGSASLSRVSLLHSPQQAQE